MRMTAQTVYVLIRDPDPRYTRFAEWGEHVTTGPTGPVALKSAEDAEAFRAAIKGWDFAIEPISMAELLALAPIYGWRDMWTMGKPDGKGGALFYAMSLHADRPQPSSRR
jgi:hypothetical protein